MTNRQAIYTLETWAKALTALEDGKRVQINSKVNKGKEAGWIPLEIDEFVMYFVENFDIRIVEPEKDWVNLYEDLETHELILGTKRFSTKKEATMEGRGSSIYIKTVRISDD